MGIPYFPMYPTDYEAKTSHLSVLEDGAYFRLLRLCWMTPGCSIPSEESWIMRRARAHTEAEKQAVRDVLAEFFDLTDGRFSNARLTQEWEAANAAHERRKNAGSKGGKAKALKTNKTGSSNALAKGKQPEPEPEPLKKEPKGSQKRASRLPEDWVLPKDWGDWAVSNGLPPDVVRFEAAQFKDYWISKAGRDALKADWRRTWQTWARRAQRDRPVSKQKSTESGFLKRVAGGAS